MIVEFASVVPSAGTKFGGEAPIVKSGWEVALNLEGDALCDSEFCKANAG